MGKDFTSLNDDVSAYWMASLDPLVKLVALAAVLIAVFSATQIWRLALLTLVVLMVVVIGRVSFPRVLGRIYALRWVLMAGLFLHLVSDWGRTLMGVSFLSLDGLITGLVVGWRLVLAVVCSSIFCWTTPVPALVAALLAVMKPVGGFVPINRIARHSMLVFMWLPLIQDEVLVFVHARKSAVYAGFNGVAGWVGEFGNLFDRLILATDTMVDAVLVGEVTVSEEEFCAASHLGFRDLGIFFVTGILLLVWFWGLP